MSTIDENTLTSMEADFAWAFLKRNQIEWRDYLRHYFAFDKETAGEFTDAILQKLEYQIDNK
jgi:hypothetical protein